MPTYRIIGADGKEYGPISAEQMRQWITEGRVNMQTRVLAEGTTEWKTVADLPEFARPVSQPGFAVPPPPPSPAAPTFPAMPTTPVYGSAADAVNGPGIALIIIGAINIMISLGFMAMVLANLGATTTLSTNSEAEKMFRGMGLSFDMVLVTLAVIFGILILLGGVRMRSLRNFGFCMTASILAMVPCLSCCFPIGIPVGIWAIVVLSKPEVKNLFS